MADKSIHLEENLGVSDSVSTTSSLNPSVIRDEFEIYREKINNDSKPAEFMVAYLILQVYIENHFHYYLRFLIGDAFTSGTVRDCWNEKNHPPKKIKCFRGILEDNQISFDEKLFLVVESNYKILTDARNAMAHGHPITKTSSGGLIEESETKKLLTLDAFNETLILTNSLMKSWDKLMTSLLGQEDACKSASLPQGGFFEHCKFKNLL